MSNKKVLLIGLRSDCVDFNKWPELSVEKLEVAFKEVVSQLTSEGYTAIWCLTDQGETAEQQVTDAIEKESPDVILIGAGVRKDPDLLILFERIINTIHKQAPNAKIAFNSLPYDSLEAIRRWI